MKRFLLLITLVSSGYVKSQCFQIQSILVDACAGSQEGQNEMVTFQVGSLPLNTVNLSVVWPNNSWLGLAQNAGTAADIATVNATILGCGFLREPIAGLLPANSKVLLVTSTAWSPLAQSFVNLSDTLYVIFQAAGNTAGHFANYASGGGTRTLTMSFSLPLGCTDAVTYDRALLINQSGSIGAQDGGAVEFTPAGVASYVNHGCQAPYIPLTVDAGVNKIVCINATQSFTGTTSGTYTSVLWSTGAGATGSFAPTNSLSTTYTPGAGDNGTIKLYFSAIKSCGTQTTTTKDSVNLTVTPLPTVTVSPSSVSICAGQSATVQANTNTAVTYTWSTGVHTNTVSLNAVGVYTVSVSNACGSSSSTVSVSLLSVPTLSVASSNPSVCASGQTATLSLSGSTGTYTWSNGSSTATTSISAPGVYTATVTTASCGSATTSISVGTAPQPTVSISAPTTTICSGGSVILTANTNTGNYLWTGGATTQTVSATTSSIVVTTTNTCGSAQATQTLTIIPLPTVTISPSSVNICAGQSAVVQANTNTAVTYTWSTGANTNTVSLNAAGVYTVNVSNACGSSSSTVNVSLLSTPSISIASSNPSVCASGQTATLSLSGSTGTYAWSNGAITATTSINAPGVYTATVTTSSCGSATTSVSVGTTPLPTVSITASTNTICSGGSTVLTANSNSGNYLWTGGATTQTVSATTSSIVVTTTNACGSAQATQTLTIVPLPTVTVTPGSISLCSGQSAVLQANPNTAVTYTWSTGAHTNSVSVNTAGVYTVNVSNQCGSATATSSVVIGSSAPTATIVSTSTVLCPGQTATLSLTGSIGTYSWSTGATTPTITVSNFGVYSATVTNTCGQGTSFITLTSMQNPTVQLSSSAITLCAGNTTTLTATGSVTNYTWSTGATGNTIQVNTAGVFTASVSNACGIASDALTVTMSNIPVLILSSSSPTICPGQTSTLTVMGGSAPYTWSNSTNTSSVVISTGGTVTVSNTNSCGTGTAFIIVSVDNIHANITANPATGLKPLVVNFINNSTGGTGYVWDFDNGHTAVTYSAQAQTYTVAGNYTVSLIVTDGVCTDRGTVIIKVLDEDFGLIIPNVFTPNNDLVNDLFKVKASGISDFNCMVFDRWGLKLFSWNDINDGWDGTNNGKPCTAGTYFYIITAKNSSDKAINKQGTISLFR